MIPAKGLTSNQLKILAMVTMTMDHVGLELLPGAGWLRILGRLSMPIYAFLIAEGCRRTHDLRRYFLRLLGLGLACQAVYYIAMGSLYMGILITFSLSVALIGTIDRARAGGTAERIAAGLTCAAAAFLCVGLPRLLPGTDYAVDYGLLGVLLPVCGYFGGMPGFAACLAALCVCSGGRQLWALAALPLLLLYNGQRGKWHMGKFFYLYYPAHLAAIYLISLVFAG